MSRTVFSVLVAVVLAATAVVAGGPTVTGETFDCYEGGFIIKSYWLFVEGEDGTCEETSTDVFECWNNTDPDINTRADCDYGCERYEGYAGCQLTDGGQVLVVPNLDVQCNDTTYRITDTDGYCYRDGAQGQPTGAHCRTTSDPSSTVTGRVTCENGCEFEGPGTTCTCVHGCEGQ